jgi:hypothetical protein
MSTLQRVIVGAVVFCGACVPATDDLAPRGALGATITPSAATRGEAFMTEDGFTVTIVRTVAYLEIDVPYEGNSGSFTLPTPGDGEFVLADLRLPLTLVLRATPPGPRSATCSLSRMSSYLFTDSSYSDSVRGREQFLRELKRNGTEDVDVAALLVGAGKSSWSGFVRLRAVRGDETWTLDLPLLNQITGSTSIKVEANVEKNALREVPLIARMENIFRRVGDDLKAEGAPRFSAFAAADTDGDRVVTIGELELAIPPRSELPPFAADPNAPPRSTGSGRYLVPPSTMAQLFEYRLSALFERP